MERIRIDENNIHMVFEITDEKEAKLLHFSALEFTEASIAAPAGNRPFVPVEVMVTGEDRTGERQGSKYIRTAPGYRLQYRDFKDYRNELGRKIELTTEDPVTSLQVISHYQFCNGIRAVRAWTSVTNTGDRPQGLEYVSSFSLTGIDKEGLDSSDDKLELFIPSNGWQKELHWNSYHMPDLGLTETQPERMRHTSKVIGIGNIGHWSTKDYLPMGILENHESGSTLFWQIEQNGSWYWEISDQDGFLYLKLSGPSEHQDHWWKKLNPQEEFVTVPVCVGSTVGGFDEAIDELTKYRRAVRRKNNDNQKLSVIFNDYMNCLYGDPTEAKEIPMIDKAAEAGCEYYVIDAGWYSDGDWWNGTGEWLPSEKRFPGGFKALLDYIKSKGMIPGVWLELEVMGINCPLAAKVPDDWFFVRHDRRITDRGRYQLDYRNPEVIRYADAVIARLAEEYGAGYIKMDYNIEPGIGTELAADSFGDGLLRHERAYLAWLDSIFRRYPDLVIENCSSGGLRMDYAMLSRYSIQSTSDTEDYREYATIAANVPSAVTPEQAAVWSYPLKDCGPEEVIFNMVNAMLLRIHQSGHLVDTRSENFDLVKEGIHTYKEIRHDLMTALPYWPLGISHYKDSWVCVGEKAKTKDYLAVWRRNSEKSTIQLPIRHLAGLNVSVRCIYPKAQNGSYLWNRESGILTVTLPVEFSARLFELSAENY